MKHPILALFMLIFGIGFAIAGGPVAWVLMVMLSPAVIFVWVRGLESSSPNPHFAAPPHKLPPESGD